MDCFKPLKIKLTVAVPPNIEQNIYNLLGVLNEVGVPLGGETDRRLERIAKACMAIGGIKNSFQEVTSIKNGHFLRTREIITFENKFLGEHIADGSYDDIRRKDLKLLVLAKIAINSASLVAKSTNDSTRGYCLSEEFADLLQTFGTSLWPQELENYKKKVKALEEELERKRELERVPITLPSGKQLLLSYGPHNQLQKAIIENFLGYFGKGCEVLYVGDTSDKFLHKMDEELSALGFFNLEHDELPDVVAYNKEKNLLFLIEAIHCTGQWDATRLFKIKQKLTKCKADIVFVSAFENLKQFSSKSKNIAWETEVWIADIPEHMIHYNGWKFLEVYK